MPENLLPDEWVLESERDDYFLREVPLKDLPSFLPCSSPDALEGDKSTPINRRKRKQSTTTTIS